MAISPTDIRILFTNYDITAYFVNLAFSSEHFISIKHRILATFNISKKKSILINTKQNTWRTLVDLFMVNTKVNMCRTFVDLFMVITKLTTSNNEFLKYIVK
jgi:hypothetical protein